MFYYKKKRRNVLRLYILDTHTARPLYIISILRLSGRTNRASLHYLINTYYFIASIT